MLIRSTFDWNYLVGERGPSLVMFPANLSEGLAQPQRLRMWYVQALARHAAVDRQHLAGYVACSLAG